MQRFARFAPIVLFVLWVLPPASAAPPEISVIYPDFPVKVGMKQGPMPHVIVGENFDESAEVWTWSPPGGEEAAMAAVEELGVDGELPTAPATPPDGARRARITDVERQVLTLTGGLNGPVVWVRNGEGTSSPYLINIPRPFWISERTAEAGEMLHMFGFALARILPSTHRAGPIVVLRSATDTVRCGIVADWRGSDARSPRIHDTRLQYFQVPADTPPGAYRVYVHNLLGGRYGWADAGELKVVAPDETAPAVFDIRDYDAAGDGKTDDADAIDDAIEAASEDGGIVHFPPGTYLTSRTLLVPPGVTLRGASAENTVIRGFAYRPENPESRPPALIRLADETALRRLTVQGAPGEPIGEKLGYAPSWASGRDAAMIETATAPGRNFTERVTIRNCRLIARADDVATAARWYRDCLSLGNPRHVDILENDITGAILFGRADRLEIIDNTIRNSALHDVIAIHGWPGAYDSILDSNRFVDNPGRVCFYPRRHSYIRYNELMHAYRGTWLNAGEGFLVHGDSHTHFTGVATAAGEQTLTCRDAGWKEGDFADKVVLVTDGRGMGQHRIVTGNTADTLTLEKPWRVTPDETSEFYVGYIYLENALFANYSNSVLSGFVLWGDCIGNVVEKHRDFAGGGSAVWGWDDTHKGTPRELEKAHEFHPSWFNTVFDCWLDGSGIGIIARKSDDSTMSAPVSFANVMLANKVRFAPLSRQAADWFHPVFGAAVSIGQMGAEADDSPAISHTILQGNYISLTPVGIGISPDARKTFINNGVFQQVDTPVKGEAVMDNYRVVGEEAPD